MSDRPQRKRIPYNSPATALVLDTMKFTVNKSSGHARPSITIDKCIQIQLWFDKHYQDRCQFGDENGKREGIEISNIEALVADSIKHMLLYSSFVKGFTFLNHEPKVERPVRIVLQREMDGNTLNVVIEAHFLDINKYEITVRTAMCVEDFKFSDNQYCIKLVDGGSSLYKFDLKNLKEICSF